MPSCRDVDIATGVFRCAKMLGDVALDDREAAVGQLVQRCRQDIAFPAGGIGQPAKAVPDAALHQEFIVLDGKGIEAGETIDMPVEVKQAIHFYFHQLGVDIEDRLKGLYYSIPD